jgi:hypothetical protein
MLSNYPKVRLAIYLIALAIGLAAIILEPRVGPEWRQALDDGCGSGARGWCARLERAYRRDG